MLVPEVISQVDLPVAGPDGAVILRRFVVFMVGTHGPFALEAPVALGVDEDLRARMHQAALDVDGVTAPA